jgi:hydroxyethylthiazole kinase-like uncharacterized protein yjeF
MKIVNVDEMRRIEQATDGAGHSYAAMMDMAGQAVAGIANGLMLTGGEKNVLILIGPGNNGGDGLVAARYLRERGHQVTAYVWKRDIKGDQNFRWLKQRRRGVAILWADNDAGFAKLREEVQSTDLIIDALLGTGVARPIEGTLADLLLVVRTELAARRTSGVEQASEPLLDMPRFPIMEAQSLGMSALPRREPPDWDEAFDEDFDEDDSGEPWADDEEDWEDWEEEEPARPPWALPPVLAVDCPSGLNCDTGALDPATLSAEVTLTFAFPKWGQLQYPGAGACGLLAVADIGVPAGLADDIQVELAEPIYIRRWLPARPADAHKGTFGKVMIVAGSLNYTGAAYLSAAAATRAGAGLITLAIPAPLHAVLAGVLPEVTWLPLPGPEGTHSAEGIRHLLNSVSSYDALLVGPGLTTSEPVRQFVSTLFSTGGLSQETWASRTVVDADALNVLADLQETDWAARLPLMSILTPHPGEMARLIGSTAQEVNAERLPTARNWSAKWSHIVVLKGAYTVVAAPDGRAAVIPFALPNLATAGSGDVLAGAIVAMLAQGLPPYEAAICGAYLHGHAGLLIARTNGMAAAAARDILEHFPEALRHLYIGK